jgi:hypothetical protein
MFYKLLDQSGNDQGVLQVNLESEEFERLAKEFMEKRGKLVSITALYKFLAKKGYAVINVEPIEVPI